MVGASGDAKLTAHQITKFQFGVVNFTNKILRHVDILPSSSKSSDGEHNYVPVNSL